MAEDDLKAGSGGYLGFVKHQIEGKPLVAFGIIILLVILLIGMYVYYHGLLMFGPFAGPAKPKGKGKGKEKIKEHSEDDEKGDDETEKLIDTINGAAAKKQPSKEK